MMDNIPGQRRAVSRIGPEPIRADFPMLSAEVNGHSLTYLDNAASTQKPRVVIKQLCRFYTEEFAKNDEEHSLSQTAIRGMDWTLEKMAALLHTPSAETVTFTQNATDALHIIASGLARSVLREGDEIMLTVLEHHSNIIPWIQACQRTGARIRVAPVTPEGDLDLDALQGLLSERTRVVSVSHVSHALGTVLPVARVAEMARAVGAVMVIDGAQATPHLPVDVQEIGCDFYVGCGHKTYGPTSVGILYGRREWLDRIPPHDGGSDNSETVSFEGWEAKPLPNKFVAGTPPVADIIATGAAVEYLQGSGSSASRRMKRSWTRISGSGSPREKVCLTSFVLEGLDDPKALSRYLDAEHGIAVRAGPLSAQPPMKHLGVSGAVRASLSFYNTRAEVDRLAEAVERFQQGQGR
jgi:cysteine desulfurase/selenocysteine lyase